MDIKELLRQLKVHLTFFLEVTIGFAFIVGVFMGLIEWYFEHSVKISTIYTIIIVTGIYFLYRFLKKILK